PTGDYYISSGGTNGLLGELVLNRAIVQEDEVELRFTAACAEPGACLATYLSSGDGEILSVPFEAWYLGTTPDDPADDVRMIPYFRESGEAPVTDFADTFTSTDNWAEGPGFERNAEDLAIAGGEVGREAGARLSAGGGEAQLDLVLLYDGAVEN
ncbi:MAG: hypothetical protein AAFP18_18800, partial [Bacteroidota bacterium]